MDRPAAWNPPPRAPRDRPSPTSENEPVDRPPRRGRRLRPRAARRRRAREDRSWAVLPGLLRRRSSADGRIAGPHAAPEAHRRSARETAVPSWPAPPARQTAPPGGRVRVPPRRRARDRDASSGCAAPSQRGLRLARPPHPRQASASRLAIRVRRARAPRPWTWSCPAARTALPPPLAHPAAANAGPPPRRQHPAPLVPPLRRHPAAGRPPPAPPRPPAGRPSRSAASFSPATTAGARSRPAPRGTSSP